MTGDPLTSVETQSLPGVGRLGRQLEETALSALYEVELDGSAGSAIVECRLAGTQQATLQLNRWREALALTHPHLLKLHDAGESVLRGTSVIYLVSEGADESLTGVLEERALSEQEVREMLEPILEALAYLHRRGFAHTSINPANVRAAGETLKLYSGSLQRIDAGGDPAADMRSLGVLLVQALSRKVPEMGEESGQYILPEASEPLNAIVQHCLEPDSSKRWTAQQALVYLSPSTAALLEPTSRPEPVPLPRQQATVLVPAPNPSVATNRKWIAGVAVVVVLIGAAVGLTRKKDAPLPVVAAPQHAAAAVGSVPTPPGPEATPVQRTASAPERTRAVPKLANRRAEGWVVVVASYGARGPAEKRALVLAKRWPSFHLDVFQPPSQKTRTLVIIGKDLSEEKAEHLRERAQQAGLASDAYIKRFE